MKFEKKSNGLYMLDVQGYVCPHPQIYTKKALEKLNDGDVLEVIFDNPSSAETISALCEKVGMDIVEKKQEGPMYTWKIRNKK